MYPYAPLNLSFAGNLMALFNRWFLIRNKNKLLISGDSLFIQFDIKINLKVYSYSYFRVVNDMYQYFRPVFADFQRTYQRAVIRCNLLYADSLRFNVFRQWILICACFRKSRRSVEINRPSVRFPLINVVYPFTIRFYCLPVRIYQFLFKSRSFIPKISFINIVLEIKILFCLFRSFVFSTCLFFSCIACWLTRTSAV